MKKSKLTYFNYDPEELLYYYNHFPETKFFKVKPLIFHNFNHDHTDLLLTLLEKNPKLNIFKTRIFYFNDYEEVLKKFLELNPDVTLNDLLICNAKNGNILFERNKHEDTFIELMDKDSSFDVMILFERVLNSLKYDKLLKKIILENPNLDLLSKIRFHNKYYVECLKLWMEANPNDDPLQFSPCNEFIFWHIENNKDFNEKDYYKSFNSVRPKKMDLVMPILKKAKDPHNFMEYLSKTNIFHAYNGDKEIVYYIDNYCNGVIPEWVFYEDKNKLPIIRVKRYKELVNRIYEKNPNHPIFKLHVDKCIFYNQNYSDIFEKIPPLENEEDQAIVRRNILNNYDISVITEKEEEMRYLNYKTLYKVLLKKVKDPNIKLETIKMFPRQYVGYKKAIENYSDLDSLIKIRKGEVSYKIEHIENIIGFIIEGII